MPAEYLDKEGLQRLLELIKNELVTIEDKINKLEGGNLDKSYVDALVDTKQDKLTAGENITIEDGVISATGGLTETQVQTIADTAAGSVLTEANAYTDSAVADIEAALVSAFNALHEYAQALQQGGEA